MEPELYTALLGVSLLAVVFDLAIKEAPVAHRLSVPKDRMVQHIIVAIALFAFLSGSLFFLPIGNGETLLTFFKEQQLSLLALVVALAAYTSSVGQKLRETAKTPAVRWDVDTNQITHEAPSTVSHIDNLHAVTVADVILVVAGILILVRIIWYVHVPSAGLRLVLDKAIIEVLGVAIFYFAYLHGYQWWKASRSQ